MTPFKCDCIVFLQVLILFSVLSLVWIFLFSWKQNININLTKEQRNINNHSEISININMSRDIGNATFCFKHELEYLKENNIITGYPPFYARNCPLHKLSYQCFPEDRVLSMNNLTLSFNVNHSYQTKENLYKTFIENRLKVTQTIFSISNFNVFIFGNSFLRQIYESLQCMIWNEKNILNEHKIMIISAILNKTNLDFTKEQDVTIPCMDTMNDVDGNELIQTISHKHYKNWNDFVLNYLHLNKSYKTENDERCIDDKSMIKFTKDNSKIFYSFQHQQPDKSLLYELKAFANYSKIDLSKFICSINVLIMNQGNFPNYRAKEKLIFELSQILKYKHENDDAFENKDFLLIMTGHFDLINSVQYAYNIESEIRKLNISYFIVNMASATSRIKYDNKTRNLYKTWKQGWHFCMPGIPSHYLLYYLKLIELHCLGNLKIGKQ